jgi:ATP-dependent helicase/nuclease subunit B
VNLLIAPPAGGKTQFLVERAMALAASGKRVWWIGLPSQRSYIYQRLTAAGALLGIEFLSSQQLYYRLLANALKLRPLIVGTGRLALVGQALLAERQELPSAGEARLFAQAIAEAKRYGVSPSQLHVTDPETERFVKVYARYEAIKGESWDYDDFRTESLRHSQNLTVKPEADAIIVDGFREISPLELRIYQALAKHLELWLSLPEPPPDLSATHTLPESPPSPPQVYRTANPVSEARWVLRAVKRDLAEGMNPLSLAVIMPERSARAFVALADEYGVPLMDETPKALADTLPGRLLLDLLELPDYPTASRLLAIPELTPLANAALARGIAGYEATGTLAAELGLGHIWQKWFDILTVPDDELRWAETLLERSFSDIYKAELDTSHLSWDDFKDYALERAKEASSLAKGANFRKWWGALLQETTVFNRPNGGVALLTANLASGRRFKKAYLMNATEGSYSVGEDEDYFIPEENREPPETSFARLRLPKRFLGRDTALYRELRSRADTMIITYPEADQGGPLEVSLDLIDRDPTTVPRLLELPAASRLELLTDVRYQAERSSVALGTATIERLRRYDACAFRFWAEQQVPDDTEKSWWQRLIHDLREHKTLNPARLEILRGAYPQAAGWLRDHSATLGRLQFGSDLPETGTPRARLDAVIRQGSEVTIYRFAAPDTIDTQDDAKAYLEGRWNELFAAGHLLSHYQGRIKRVNLVVWPINQEPIPVYDDGIDYVWRRISNRQEKITAAYTRFSQGDVSPNPGFRCRECRVADICREGAR